MSKFLIYKSSAGSGKTYTLVKEYLKIVLKNPNDFRHTLAVTFTNKAAGEMKSRIVTKLKEIAEGKDKELEKKLIDEGVPSDISARAKKVLENILHKYSYFSVVTIDSFFHRVIRAFAKELRLHIAYNIEVDDEKVMAKIVDDVLADIGTNKELTSYLEDFALSRIDESKDWKIEKEITKIGAEIFKERFFEKRTNIKTDITQNREKLRQFIDRLFIIVSDFENAMTECSKKANEIMKQHGLVMLDFPHGKSGFINYLLKKIAEKNYEPTKRVLEVYDKPEKWFDKSASPQVKEAVSAGLRALLEKAVTNYKENSTDYYTAKELQKSIYVLGIYKDLQEKLKDYRDENRLMLISDTTHILQNVIGGETSPFVYEKIGNTYKYFLIDEFQDTSTYQWKNLLPLIINSLAENYFSMVVGDIKQSIYRWRNGNMRLLLEQIYTDLHGYEEVLEKKYLDVNFRSKKEIVSFNNRFFSTASDYIINKTENNYNFLIAKAYADIEQKSSKNEGGYVNISFIRKDADEIPPKERALLKLKETIKSVLDDGFRLKDILILVRINAEGSEIASMLMGDGYKVISNESLYLINSTKVKLLINLLKYIIDRRNTIAGIEILYNLINIKGKDIPPEKIFSDMINSEGSLFRSLMPTEFFRTDEKSGVTEYNKLNPELNNLSLYELIEKLIRIFNLNTKSDSYLLRFQDLILEFLKDNNPDITGFLQWWEDNKFKYSVIVPEDENAIRVMTIHTAKGLQSPIVIIPYADWTMDIEGFKDLIWVSNENAKIFNQSVYPVRAVKDLTKSHFSEDYHEEYALTRLDNLNLLYVSFTRPIERLYVTVPERKTNFNAGTVIKDIIVSDITLNSRYNFDKDEFEAGTKTRYPAEEREKNTKPENLDEYVSNDWHKKVVILPRHRNSQLFNKELNIKTRKGLLVHEILSNVKTREDIDNAIYIALNNGSLTKDEADSVKKEILQLTDLDETKDWFSGSWEVKTESDILMPDGKSIRPDRVMLKGKKAVIADYKTGKKSEEHHSQLESYSNALKKAGYEQIEKYIVYLDDKEIVKI